MFTQNQNKRLRLPRSTQNDKIMWIVKILPGIPLNGCRWEMLLFISEMPYLHLDKDLQFKNFVETDKWNEYLHPE